MDSAPSRRSLRAAKLTVGAVLAVLSLGTLGGLLYLGVLQVNDAATLEDPLVRVVVETPSGTLFDGVVGAGTPLEALERAGLASGFGVARKPDGRSLQSAAGLVDGEGGVWSFELTRAGASSVDPGPEGSFPLEPDDAARWFWTPL